MASYKPDIFEVDSYEAARHIILTPESGGPSTDERWETETPYLAEMVARDLALDGTALAIDYGCGVGRMSRALIEATGCRVIGADISASMRAMASGYVEDGRFTVTGLRGLDALAAHGLQADAALAIWVLQHIPNVESDIALLNRALKPGAKLALANMRFRVLPTDDGWARDDKDVPALLEAGGFALLEERVLDTRFVSEVLSERSFYRIYEKRETVR